MYEVITFVGDYPVEDQPCWTEQYHTITQAMTEAIKQHASFMEIENNEHYTVVLDSNDTSEDVKWIIYQGKELLGDEATALADKLAYGEIP
jgi:hypothetical protein